MVARVGESVMVNGCPTTAPELPFALQNTGGALWWPQPMTDRLKGTVKKSRIARPTHRRTDLSTNNRTQNLPAQPELMLNGHWGHRRIAESPSLQCRCWTGTGQIGRRGKSG